MAAMSFNRGEIEYAIESPDGEMGTSVPYGEVANHVYDGHVYIAYCEDRDTGDTQIYRMVGNSLMAGLELVETEVADTEFDEDGEDGEDEDNEDSEDGDDEDAEDSESGEDSEDGEGGEDNSDGDDSELSEDGVDE